MSRGWVGAAILIGLAGVVMPILPLVEIGGVAVTGYSRVDMVPGWWLPAALPTLALVQTRAPRPWARWLLLGLECLVALGLAIVAQVELTFSFDSVRILPAGWVLMAVQVAGAIVGVGITAKGRGHAEGAMPPPSRPARPTHSAGAASSRSAS